ncbi:MULTISPECIES: LysM peptidoglycan-binding domain-containing protein [unclassified Brevibacterium]|uniref:LysM peptidoglycan-binding domain-containing protein n=1 Tax=unclassified Brevibacterium TaxID=2614124 RepID=UPI0010811077|nr:LysM peptidoglycan-binding domain-containing protein [Brevibacterium sp. S111]TGD11256.1 LysM peptidoglycan-binding domain-containing protein [Brevibacterium sp. S111]
MSAQNTGLRLTTRGRQAVRLLRTLLIALVVIGGALLLATQSFSAAAVAEPESESIGIEADAVVVGEGESLWTVASSLGLDRDTRDVVADIVDINHLTTPTVHPGQTLDVPVR